jgi:RNA polymerase sigma factor (sigma-70 family)
MASTWPVRAMSDMEVPSQTGCRLIGSIASNAVSPMSAHASKAVNPVLPSWNGGGDVSRHVASASRPTRPPARPAPRLADWRTRSQRWGCLMAAAQRGESRAYEQLLRELDNWLRGYYARRRLPAMAAEDARQEALLAIHANRHTYVPSRPFGPWVAAIARYKWVDHLREAARSAALSFDEELASKELAGENHGELAMSGIAIVELLSRIKPAQAAVIRLVKLEGITVEGASRATGQSVALVKVNIHRGLKKLTELATCDAGASTGSSCAASPSAASLVHENSAATRDVEQRMRAHR